MISFIILKNKIRFTNLELLKLTCLDFKSIYAYTYVNFVLLKLTCLRFDYVINIYSYRIEIRLYYILTGK